MNFEKFQPQIAQMNADVPSAGTHLCPSATSAAKEENALCDELRGIPTVAKFATVQCEGTRMTIPAVISRLPKGRKK